MKTRVKVFTYHSSHGATVVESPLQDQINQWLSSVEGEIVEITQSESERSGVGQHVTLCIWFLPTD
jgi:hypothetical protein